jgi:DNA-directed RNA polymerase subunit M/transcription elongation factor TFIIS
MAQHAPTMAGTRRGEQQTDAQPNRAEAIAMRRIISERGFWLSPFMKEEPLPSLTEWETTTDLVKLQRNGRYNADGTPAERELYPRRDAFEVKPPPIKTTLEQRLIIAKDSYGDLQSKARKAGREVTAKQHSEWQGRIAGIEAAIRRQNASPEEKAQMQREAIERIGAVRELVMAKEEGRKPMLPEGAPAVKMKRKKDKCDDRTKMSPEKLEKIRARERERSRRRRGAINTVEAWQEARQDAADRPIPTAKELVAEAKAAKAAEAEQDAERRRRHKEKEARAYARRKQKRKAEKRPTTFMEGYTKALLETDLDFAVRFMATVRQSAKQACWYLEKKGKVITQTVMAQQHYKFVEKYMYENDCDPTFIERKLQSRIVKNRRNLDKLKVKIAEGKHAKDPKKPRKRTFNDIYKASVKELQETCDDQKSL